MAPDYDKLALDLWENIGSNVILNKKELFDLLKPIFEQFEKDVRADERYKYEIETFGRTF